MFRINRSKSIFSTINVPLTFYFLFLITLSSASGQSITSFTLINAQTNTEISELVDGASIVLDDLPTNQLNIRANTSGTIGSVVFLLNGVKNRTENVTPYALFGDKNSNYYTWTPELGSYTIVANAYSLQQGNGSLLDSEEITITFIEADVEPTTPNPPSNLVGTSSVPNQVILTWDDNANNESGFLIQYRDANYFNVPWQNLVSLPSEATTYEHSNLQNNEVNYYRIRSFNANGSSDFTNEIEVGNFPSPPTNHLVSEITETSFHLSWTQAPYGNDYLIQSSTSPNGDWTFFDALYYGYTEFNYSGLDPGTTYYFRMRTNFQGSSSDWSTVFSVTILTDEAEPVLPTISQFTLVNADSDQDINIISEGDTFYLDEIGTNQLNIRADVEGEEESVVFAYNGVDPFSLENVPVYAIGGNNGSDYKPWIPALGLNQVSAAAYTQNAGQGEAGPTASINFVILEEKEADPNTGVDLGVSGELRKWHKVTVAFEGPELSENGSENPFSDYRLDVTFSNGEETFIVPGYFAADGASANTSASSGKIWKAHFSPNKIGTWTYSASFRSGENVALSANINAGTSTSFDGSAGSFEIQNTNKTGRDFRGKGRLNYIGEHYLQFEDSGEFFIKAGADAPENTFAYDDFDATPNKSGRRKSWEPHAGDFSLSDAGDYTWGSDTGDGGKSKGRAMLGMLKYLSDQGMNVFSFLTFSLDGDDGNVYPHLQKISGATNWSNVEHMRFDVSKLAQWEKILEYADKKGIFIHFKTQETENDQQMDGGLLGNERKLYYRELIARFGHHLALNWNLGEEHDIWSELNDPQNINVKEYAAFISDVDPYDHHIVIHTYPGQQDEVYGTLTGNQSTLTGPSIQSSGNNIHNDVRRWVENSRSSGKKWVVCNDEQGSANAGVTVDADYPTELLPEPRNVADNRFDVRSKVLWGTLMAGGAGVEYYYGYQSGCDDLDCQDHRTRQSKWDDASHALNFFNSHLQDYLLDMTSNDALTSNNADYVFAKENEVYVIYLPTGATSEINLGETDDLYTIKWYDPRSGGSLQEGSETEVLASTSASIGTPPNALGSDWVAILTNTGVEISDIDLAKNRSIKNEFKLFPNPSSDRITIVLDDSDDLEEHILQIINSNGQSVLTKTILSASNNIDLSHLPPGNYMALVKGQEIIARQQFIIIK